MRVDIMGVGFDDCTLEHSIQRAGDIIENRGCGYVVTPNPEILWSARKDEDLKDALNSASLVLPDGVGVIYSAKILGTPLGGKVTGVDFCYGVLEMLGKSGGSVFLLGAKPGVAEKAADEILKTYEGIRIAGVQDGYFKEDEPVVEMINEAKPDFLIVCLGFPRQEKFMRKYKGQLNVGIMAGLGGVLDVIAGTVQRAPEAWQNKNLEWLYRLLKEPSRFKRQIKIPAFMLTVVGRRIRGSR